MLSDQSARKWIFTGLVYTYTNTNYYYYYYYYYYFTLYQEWLAGHVRVFSTSLRGQSTAISLVTPETKERLKTVSVLLFMCVYCYS